MHKIFILILSILGCHALSAQSYTTTVEYQKTMRQAVINSIPFPEKTVAEAIEDTMQKLGYKGKDAKGFTVYRGVKIPSFNNVPVDLYFMVDKKSRKEKESSLVTLILSKGFEDFVTQGLNPELITMGKRYLDSLQNIIFFYDLEQQITEQEDVMRSNEKKSNSLIEEADDLQKKKKKIEKDIEENIKAQSNMKSESEKQQQILETLKGKRRQ